MIRSIDHFYRSPANSWRLLCEYITTTCEYWLPRQSLSDPTGCPAPGDAQSRRNQPERPPQQTATAGDAALSDSAPQELAVTTDHNRDDDSRVIQENGFDSGIASVQTDRQLNGGEQNGGEQCVSYSFIAYRKFHSAV